MLKTPVSLLHELCLKRGIQPQFDLVQIEGAAHKPTFKYRVSAGEFVATGCGQSKKQAKHTAAESMLDQISAEEGLEAVRMRHNSVDATEVKEPVHVVEEGEVEHPACPDEPEDGGETPRREEERKRNYDEALEEVARVRRELDELRREGEELKREKAELRLQKESGELEALRRRHQSEMEDVRRELAEVEEERDDLFKTVDALMEESTKERCVQQKLTKFCNSSFKSQLCAPISGAFSPRSPRRGTT